MNRLGFLCCVLLAFVQTLPAAPGSTTPDWPRTEQHALALLQQYIRIASVNPPADTRATADLLRREFEQAGFSPKIYQSTPEGKTNLLVRLPGRDSSLKPLLLLNHMDVVPVDAKQWPIDPFGAIVKDGQLWGRGALDMKCVGVMQLTAIILMKQLGIVPPRDIVFLATADEETNGEGGAAWMMTHHWPELDPAYVLDEGGFGSTDVFTPNKLIFGISVGDKQVVWLQLQARGTSGHASQPIADNANDTLLHAIEKARAIPSAGSTNAIVEQMRQSVAGKFASNKFINAIQQNTISLTTLRSGVGDPPKANVIPSIAEATLDCRLLPGQNADEFVSGIKARINDPRVAVTRLNKTVDAAPSNTNTPLFESMKRSIGQTFPGAVVTPILVPYGTDGQKFRSRGIPVYGLTPMVVDAATVATMHSDKEHININQFNRGLHFYFDLLAAGF